MTHLDLQSKARTVALLGDDGSREVESPDSSVIVTLNNLLAPLKQFGRSKNTGMLRQACPGKALPEICFGFVWQPVAQETWAEGTTGFTKYQHAVCKV